jgi:hypothetical protein
MAQQDDSSVLVQAIKTGRVAELLAAEPQPPLKADDARASSAAAARTGAGSVLGMLRALPALPKVHYSWPFCHMEYSCTPQYMATALPWSDPAVMKEYARITRSVTAFASPTGYSNLTDAAVDTMYEKLAAGVHGVPGGAYPVPVM